MRTFRKTLIAPSGAKIVLVASYHSGLMSVMPRIEGRPDDIAEIERLVLESARRDGLEKNLLRIEYYGTLFEGSFERIFRDAGLTVIDENDGGEWEVPKE